MLLQPRPNIPFTFPKLSYVRGYLLRDEFTTDAAAPLASPRTCEPGPGTLTITDTANRLSISGGKLARADSVAVSAWEDPRLVGAGIARAAGLALRAHFRVALATSNFIGGWRDTATGGSPSIRHGVYIENPALVRPWGTSVEFPDLESLTADTDYSYALVLRGTGAFLFLKGGTQFPAWTLGWVFQSGTQTPLYPSLQYQKAGAVTVDYLRVRQLGAPFTTDNGIATLNVASPAVQDYTATADQILDLTLTAPAGSITTEAGIIYRKLDANNYWRAYFNTAGAFRVDSVSGGVATNRVGTSGAITAGATRTIRIRMSGSRQDAYTLNNVTWTKRGAQFNVSHQDTQVTVQPQIGAGWAAPNLRSCPNTSSAYDVLDAI